MNNPYNIHEPIENFNMLIETHPKKEWRLKSKGQMTIMNGQHNVRGFITKLS